MTYNGRYVIKPNLTKPFGTLIISVLIVSSYILSLTDFSPFFLLYFI